MKKLLFFALIAFSLAGCASQPASPTFTQSVATTNDDEQNVITRISPQLIEFLLGEIDSNYEEIGNNFYFFRTRDGYKVALLNADAGNSIEIATSFKVERITLSRVNEWNRTRKFTTAYLDEDDDLILYAALKIDGGITARTLVEFIELYLTSLDLFYQEMI